jgi:hypothetical protein
MRDGYLMQKQRLNSQKLFNRFKFNYFHRVAKLELPMKIFGAIGAVIKIAPFCIKSGFCMIVQSGFNLQKDYINCKFLVPSGCVF